MFKKFNEMVDAADANSPENIRKNTEERKAAREEALISTSERIKGEGELMGLPSNAIETAQAVELGTFEGGKILRRGV